MNIQTVIMAAGKGTRMHSDLPKVLHPILGKPMLWHSIQAVREVQDALPVVVIGHQAEVVRQAVDGLVRFVVQEEQNGTAHAVLQTRTVLENQADIILVTSADMPLISGKTLQTLAETQRTHNGPMSLLIAEAQDARGFGRILQDENGMVQAIVEEADATEEQRAIRLLNVGVYAFDAAWLWENLPRVPVSPKGEYYITSLVDMAVSAGQQVRSVVLSDLDEIIGVNTRIHLAEATAAMQRRINRRWMLSGVTMISPQDTWIEPQVTLGQDTIVWPNTYLKGRTTVGQGCEIGPNTIVQDTVIGSRCKIVSSVLESAVLEDDVDIGPFGHLRKGAHLAQGVHMGNFGEVKNSYLGPGF